MPSELPSHAPPSIVDLTADELDRLSELLETAPEPLQPPGLPALDGFLCGVLVQALIIPEAQWLPYALDIEGRSPPPEAAAWRAEVDPLVRRRLAVLRERIEVEGWFEPIVYAFDDEHPPAVSEYEPLSVLPPASQAVAPWVHGFCRVDACFDGLKAIDDLLLDAPLERLLRHVPLPFGPRPVPPPIDPAADPNAGIDAAIAEVVEAVVELYDLTADARLHVETIRRETPKVGRNDPCPCGSGRKFKRCHGAG